MYCSQWRNKICYDILHRHCRHLFQLDILHLHHVLSSLMIVCFGSGGSRSILFHSFMQADVDDRVAVAVDVVSQEQKGRWLLLLFEKGKRLLSDCVKCKFTCWAED